MDTVVARSDDAKGQLVFRVSGVALGAEIAIEPDDEVVVVQAGNIVGAIESGTHLLEPGAFPFLEALVTDGSKIDGEFVFVKITLLRGIKIGGPVGLFTDPTTRIPCRPRLDAEMSLRVSDPAKLVTAFTSGSIPEENESLFAFVKTHVLECAARSLDTALKAGSAPLHDLTNIQAWLATSIGEQLGPLEDHGVQFVKFASLAVQVPDSEVAAMRSRSSPSMPAVNPQQAPSLQATTTCPRCGAAARANFCTQCGSPLDARWR